MIEEKELNKLESGEEVLESGDEPSTPVTTKIEIVETSSVDLTSDSLDIAQKIVEAKNEEELKKYTDLFNLSMAKKNAVRIVKLNSLYDKVTEEAGERIEKRSDEITNKELLDYMKALQDSIDKAQSGLKAIDSNTQMITLNQQTNTVNVTVNTEEGSVRSRESKEKIIQAVRGLLKLAQESNLKSEDAIEAEVVEPVKVETVEDDNEEVYIVEDE